jgi:hypothetical protein
MALPMTFSRLLPRIWRKEMADPIVITVPMSINPRITPNASRMVKPVWKSSIHKQMKAKAAKATIEAMQAVHQAIIPPVLPTPITVHILWAREKHRKAMDNDNLIASCKWFLDAIAETIGVNDKHFIIGSVTQERDTVGKGYMKFVLEPRETEE